MYSKMIHVYAYVCVVYVCGLFYMFFSTVSY